MHDLLDRLNITGFDAGAYIDEHSNNGSALPNIGIAVSGGGYRALLNGAGTLAAFDSRTAGSTSIGHLGGILQSSTYISGLSGGAWLLGSIFVNNFTTIPALLGDSTPGGVWDFNRSILLGPENQPSYYRDLLDSVLSKREAGFAVSITDPWSAT
jgi:lysophospholipase